MQVRDSGRLSAEENMRLDAELLEGADQLEAPLLRLYEWEGDSATYGYFTDPAKLLDVGEANRRGLHLARRPTGGGIVFHIWDMAFSVIVPAHSPLLSNNTLENYALVNNAVLDAVKEFLQGNPPLSLTPEDFKPWDRDCFHFCMAKPTQYDVMWEGKKIAGAAQRKTKKGFLHQGTIALTLPPAEYLEAVLLPGTQVKQAMFAHTYPLLGGAASPEQVASAKQKLRSLLATHLREAPVSSCAL